MSCLITRNLLIINQLICRQGRKDHALDRDKRSKNNDYLKVRSN